MKNIIYSILIVLISASCSDFSNKNNSPQNPNPTEGPQKPEGSNSFPKDYDPNQGQFNEEKMLANIGLNVIYPKVKKLRLSLELLDSENKTRCSKLKAKTNTDESLDQVKSLWKQAMLAFHEIEIANIGPLQENKNAIQLSLYAWPFFSSCVIDTDVTNKSLGKDNPSPSTLARGLGALEYLFFENTLNSSCPIGSSTTVADWNNKPIDEKKLNRCEHSVDLTKLLVKDVSNLEQLWNPDGNNFSKKLVDGSKFKSLKDSINNLTDSFFNLEKVKDLKLRKPLGGKGCLNDTCPEDIEHKWSGLSLEAIKSNLAGFEDILEGKTEANANGFGIDDYLLNLGHSDTWNSLKSASLRALTAANESINEGTLEQQILKLDKNLCDTSTADDRKIKPCGLRESLKLMINNNLKIDLLTALSLAAPSSGQGDSD